MTAPLTAGDPLLPPSPEDKSRRPGKPEPGRNRKRAPRRRSVIGRLIAALFGLMTLVIIVGAIAGYAAYMRFSADLPDVEGLRNYQPPVMSRVYAGDARPIAELATERRIFVPYGAIPDVVKHAFVSAEDQNFWVHRGVDPVAILRAAITDLSQYGQGRRPIGASTITQQVAKNMLLDNQVSMARKAKEAILAIRIEGALSKERILELYLNEIYLGLQSYGVAAAGQAYFNKSLDQLTIAEAAFLAALPKAPNNLNPFKYPDAARTRRDYVLDRMADDHAITQAQAAAAKAEPIVPSQFRRPEPVPGADWFAEEVRRRLIEQFGPEATTQGGLMVRTSLDPALQEAAERAVHDGLIAYDRHMGGWRGPVAHLDAVTGPRADWTGALGQAARPLGMLASWKLAVVLEAGDGEAKVGWLDRAPGSQVLEPRQGTMLLSDTGWARALHDGKPSGPAPRKLVDVVHVGDVVMVEPAPTAAVAAKGRAAVAARADRALLRQIPLVQGALVSLDPATGRVLAMVGGWSFEQSQFNRVTQANRQPGSSFKPFVYLTALEQGISPSQRFLDAPLVIDNGAGGRWRPNNYEMDFNGPTPLRIALEKSLNLVTIRVADLIGMEAVAQTAIAFHEVDNMPRVLPAAIGAVDTTVLREAGAYAGLAAGGREVIPTFIDSVQDRDGHVVWRAGAGECDTCSDPAAPPPLVDTRKQIADPQSDFQLVTMMQGVVQRGTGVTAGAGLNRTIAGKTGTTQDFTDAWFAGFTPDLVTVVWAGFDTPNSLGNNETGAAVSAPIWHDFMAVALKSRPPLQFQAPPGVTLATWDSGSGPTIDAFKPDQMPGASKPLGERPTTAVSSDAGTPDAAPPPAASGGVDSSMGGLY
jgi:penicillin-binding protein 1A